MATATKTKNKLKSKLQEMKDIILLKENTMDAILTQKSYTQVLLKYTFTLLGLYTVLYFLTFLANYYDMQALNEIQRQNMQKQKFSTLFIFFSSYPWNISFFIMACMIIEGTTTAISYLILIVFGEKQRNFAIHSRVCLHSCSYFILAFFPILVVNTFFPSTDKLTTMQLGLLIGVWLFVFMTAFSFSLRSFYKLSKRYLQLNGNLLVIVWLLPILLFSYFAYSSLIS
ncbi:MAG: hypothetical protein AAF518_03125 [Spirochaetota bacterium]